MSDRRQQTTTATDARIESEPDAAAVPPGLLEALRAEAGEPVRRSGEVDRVRRRLEQLSLDDEHVLHGIATKLLLASTRG